MNTRTDSAPHRIVIVGGGAGGLELATRLGETFGRKGLADITDLAISVESRGGVEPGALPRLPHLYAGALIQKAQ